MAVAKFDKVLIVDKFPIRVIGGKEYSDSEKVVIQNPDAFRDIGVKEELLIEEPISELISKIEDVKIEDSEIKEETPPKKRRGRRKKSS